MQTRAKSFVEALASTGMGFIISWLLTFYMLPLFGYTSVTEKKAFVIVCIFTVASLLRIYIVRRAFNGRRG